MKIHYHKYPMAYTACYILLGNVLLRIKHTDKLEEVTCEKCRKRIENNDQ